MSNSWDNFLVAWCSMFNCAVWQSNHSAFINAYHQLQGNWLWMCWTQYCIPSVLLYSIYCKCIFTPQKWSYTVFHVLTLPSKWMHCKWIQSWQTAALEMYWLGTVLYTQTKQWLFSRKPFWLLWWMTVENSRDNSSYSNHSGCLRALLALKLYSHCVLCAVLLFTPYS